MQLAPAGPRAPRGADGALLQGLAALAAEVGRALGADVVLMVPRPRGARGAAAAVAVGGSAPGSTTTTIDPALLPVQPSGVEDDLLPAPGGDGSDHPAPEGDTATALALLRRAQDGDADAFGELYDRYVDLVYRYVYYRVGSAALAEDLTSECFLRALRRITSFTWQGRDPGAWFVTIARNLIADHYKSGRYRLELTTDDVTESAPPQTTASPEAEVLEGITNGLLLQAVKQLNAEQQECIVLRFLQGLSVSETAAVMGKNDGAIKALQYRAVKSLGRLLPEGLEL